MVRTLNADRDSAFDSKYYMSTGQRRSRRGNVRIARTAEKVTNERPAQTRTGSRAQASGKTRQAQPQAARQTKQAQAQPSSRSRSQTQSRPQPTRQTRQARPQAARQTRQVQPRPARPAQVQAQPSSRSRSQTQSRPQPARQTRQAQPQAVRQTKQTRPSGQVSEYGQTREVRQTRQTRAAERIPQYERARAVRQAKQVHVYRQAQEQKSRVNRKAGGVRVDEASHETRGSGRRSITSMSLQTVAGMIAVIAIMTVILISYIKLQADVTTTSRQIANLEQQLTQIKAENDAAYNEINDSISLEEVRRRAIQDLGMKYADRDQVVIYSGAEKDSVHQVSSINEN